MGRYWAILGLLLFALLIFGCTESSSQYSPSRAEELVNTSNPAGAPEQNKSILVHRYSSLIGTSFADPDQNITITIKGFDITYEKEQDVNRAHILFLIENIGKKAAGEACSDFTLIDEKERKFTLETQFESHFGRSEITYGEIQPGLSIFTECSQVFPKNATLTSLIIRHWFKEPTIIANLSREDV